MAARFSITSGMETTETAVLLAASTTACPRAVITLMTALPAVASGSVAARGAGAANVFVAAVDVICSTNACSRVVISWTNAANWTARVSSRGALIGAACVWIAS
ncbi:Uncharacterised protein [Mycobacteroides abscessus subsp. abscessus]|nr:Uncharacterised protein [Mycobacteroides abscessus subsp. abscessus]